MKFLPFFQQHKKVIIVVLVTCILISGGLIAYFLFSQQKTSGTLLEQTPEEIARRLREERAADIAMTDEERIRQDPIGYIENNLIYYYAIKDALGRDAVEEARNPTRELSKVLDTWYAVVLSNTQREQIDMYRKSVKELDTALAVNNKPAALSAFGGLRYLETMVLEARKDEL